MDLLTGVAGLILAKQLAVGAPVVVKDELLEQINGTVAMLTFTKRDLRSIGARGIYRRSHAVIALSSAGDITGSFLKGGKPKVVCTFDGFYDPVSDCVLLSGCEMFASSCL